MSGNWKGGGDLIERIEQRTKLAGHNRLGLLLFRAGRGALFAINVFKVQEITFKQSLFSLPGLAKGFEGVVSFRGKTINVMDLCKRIPLPEDHREPSRFMIVTEFNQSVQGFLVQSLERIINVSVRDLDPPPVMGLGNSGLLTAVTRHQGRLVQVLDLETILAETLESAIPPILEKNGCLKRHCQ